MRRILAFFILSSIKAFSSIFYRGKFQWLTPLPEKHWKKTRIMIFLNHTSLYEPLFLQVIPFSYLWHLAGHFNIPGADVTLKRPIVGLFWKLMIPNISSITRKKDTSWLNYLKSIKPDDVIMIAPEGRMKRPNGLDRFGKPMTVRGGVADIIDAIDDGSMIICFSGGLHQVQAPGEHFPSLFKTIQMNLSYFDLKEYKAKFVGDSRERKLKIVRDLQQRLERDCPAR